MLYKRTSTLKVNIQESYHHLSENIREKFSYWKARSHLREILSQTTWAKVGSTYMEKSVYFDNNSAVCSGIKKYLTPNNMNLF